MNILAPLALSLCLAAPAAQATVVDFNADLAPGQGLGTYSSGGLTFTDSGAFQYLGIWDGSSPNSNGTNNLIFAGYGGGDFMTITRTGGGMFDLLSFDMAISFYSGLITDTIAVNGNPFNIDNTATNYLVNLFGVNSVTISGLSAMDGYWTADNFEYNISAVPVPAALPLMLLALGGLGVVARRGRKAV